MSSLSDVISVSSSAELRLGTSIHIVMDIWEALKALRKDHIDGSLPESLQRAYFTFTLYAAAKAQGELTDADCYREERAREILTAQGYEIDFDRRSAERPSCLNGEWQDLYVVDGRLADSVYVTSTTEHQTLFDVFQQMNQGDEAIWQMKREQLLYIPEEILLCFGGQNWGDSHTILSKTDDRNEDELPCIKANRIDEPTLKFLLGGKLQKRGEAYLVNPSH